MAQRDRDSGSGRSWPIPPVDRERFAHGPQATDGARECLPPQCVEGPDRSQATPRLRTPQLTCATAETTGSSRPKVLIGVGRVVYAQGVVLLIHTTRCTRAIGASPIRRCGGLFSA